MEDDDDFGELYTDVLQSFHQHRNTHRTSPFAPPQKPSDPAQSAQSRDRSQP
ncbi:unnamed protein product [Rhodiola kirilowii]